MQNKVKRNVQHALLTSAIIVFLVDCVYLAVGDVNTMMMTIPSIILLTYASYIATKKQGKCSSAISTSRPRAFGDYRAAEHGNILCIR